MLKEIKADLNYDIPHDNKNSGQALAQILAEKSNPVGDIGYFGVTFGMKAKAQDALEPYKPAKWEVFSNHATTEMRDLCMELGADCVFDKSNEIDELLSYCNRLAQEDKVN